MPTVLVKGSPKLTKLATLCLMFKLERMSCRQLICRMAEYVDRINVHEVNVSHQQRSSKAQLSKWRSE